MKIGYIRVSKQEQHEALQRDALQEAGCEKCLSDKMTGSKVRAQGIGRAARVYAARRYGGRLEARPPGPLSPGSHCDAQPPAKAV